jgi:hypothetical protein
MDGGNSKCMVNVTTGLASCGIQYMCYFLDLQCQMTEYLESTVGCWMYIFRYRNFSFYKCLIANFYINNLKTVIISVYDEFVNISMPYQVNFLVICTVTSATTRLNGSAPVCIGSFASYF